MDWIDIMVHGAVAVLVGLFVGATGLWPLLVLNAIFWPLRETFQHAGFPHTPQSTLEWVVPVVLCPLAAVALRSVR